MQIALLCRTALRSLLHHKIRSALTMIGIISGIAAVVSTIAIGHGAEEKIRNEILAYGNNYLILWSGNMNDQGVITKKARQNKPLVLSDIESIKRQCSGIAYISPVMFHGGTIEYNGITVAGEIKGGNEQGLEILGRKIGLGRNFTKDEADRGARVIVIGSKVAQDCFQGESAVGKLVKVGSTYFCVIGVAAPIKQFGDWRDPNHNSYIPLKALKKYIHKSNTEYIHGIALSAQSLEIMPRVVNDVTVVMRARHRLKKNDKSDFTVMDQASMLGAAKSTSGTFNLFLLIVASIALIVGGIGVMNIMLVAVSERTQEIGIKKALGATDSTILGQFLIESIFLCGAGGMVGIALGVLAPMLAHRFAQFPMVITPSVIIIAVLTIIAIGIIFGYYPAWKAARLNPVEALSDR